MDNFYYKIRRLIFNDWLLDGLLEAVDDGMPIKVIASRFNLTTYTTRKLIAFARSPGRATRNPEDVAYCTRYQDPNNKYQIEGEFS